ncbi:hypothetical protein BRD10_00830 [Halobacteriales archaeon SW_12_71_31]|nr:MAG: hypothetical protein BRD10_00830 [Halobacteriales archaeon SW_12_71_31]
MVAAKAIVRASERSARPTLLGDDGLQRRHELDRRFRLFAVVGATAAVLVLITVAVFVDSFVL